MIDEKSTQKLADEIHEHYKKNEITDPETHVINHLVHWMIITDGKINEAMQQASHQKGWREGFWACLKFSVLFFGLWVSVWAMFAAFGSFDEMINWVRSFV